MTIQTTPTGLTIIIDKVDQTNELTLVRGNVSTKVQLSDLELKYLALTLQQEDNEE